MGADTIEWFAEERTRFHGRLVASRTNPAIRQMVLRDPVGAVAAFAPWNFPIKQVVRKVGAALSAGCSMLVKGPEETPAAPAALVQVFADAGLPDGVLMLGYGDPAQISACLIPHPVIRKVTFTGSTPVGKELVSLVGQKMKRVTMELGGHAPVIVAGEADVDLAAKVAGGAKFRNAGQVCISPTRFLVHRSVAQDFAQAFDSLEDAIGETKRLVYGLAGYAFSKSLRIADELTRRVEVGMLWINMPASPRPRCRSAASRTRGMAPKPNRRLWRPILACAPWPSSTPEKPDGRLTSSRTADEPFTDSGLAGYTSNWWEVTISLLQHSRVRRRFRKTRDSCPSVFQIG